MDPEQMAKYLANYSFHRSNEAVLEYFQQIAKFDQAMAANLLGELLSTFARADTHHTEIEELRSIIDNRNLRIQALENELRNRDPGDAGRLIMISGSTDRKINFIKLVREYSGLGLKESKDLVEDLANNPGGEIAISKQTNCLEPCRVIADLRNIGLIVNN